MFVDDEAYDVLYLGTSRTFQNIDVQICDSITGRKNYNLGMGGAGGFEILSVFKAFLQVHPTPKNVVLNFDRNILDTLRGFHNPIPYFNHLNNDEVNKTLKEKGYPVWFYKNVPFTRVVEFNDDTRNNCIRGLLGKKDSHNKGYHGFLPNYEKIGKFDTVYKTKTMIGHSKGNFRYVDSIVEICQKQGINLIFVVSPVYKKHFSKRYLDYDLIMGKVKTEYNQGKGIPILFFDTLPLNFNKSYFADNIHLNRIGTTQFSIVLSQKIMEVLK
ncbi:MAG: hypothetical protein J0L87_14105 [Bacteroidetes bacterium]|nr:hypothetical protein [Bacteroidota bacterium]